MAKSLDQVFANVRRDTLGISDVMAWAMVKRWRSYAAKSDARADAYRAHGMHAHAQIAAATAAEWRKDADDLAAQLDAVRDS